MRLGLALPHYDFSYPDGRSADVDTTVEWARRAEALGYDSVWVSDHFFLDISRYGGPAGRYGSLEPLTTLAAIAAATQRVRLGTLVLSEAFRSPAMLAKQVATLDQMSHGRLEIGLGAGWYQDEYAANGYEFGPAGKRMTRLSETLQIVGALLSDGKATFKGEQYGVDGAVVRPGPWQKPRPPLWVGSKGGDRSLGMVAAHADGWNTAWRWKIDDYAARAAALNRACEQRDRDPATVRRSIGLYALITDDPKADWERWRAWAPAGVMEATTLEEFSDGVLVGDAGHCAERVAAYAAHGATELIVSPAPLPFSIAIPEQVDRIAAELLPLIRDV